MTELVRRLQATATDVFPPTPALEEAVAARLEGAPERRRRAPSLVLALAAALAVAAGLALSPGARSAVLDALDLVPGVEIRRTERLPPAVSLTTYLEGLGEPVSLRGASRQAGFQLRLPRGLPEPDLVLLDRGPGGSAVTVVYGSREGAASLVLTQWHPSRLLFKKLLASPDTLVQVVRVDGAAGLWIVGDDHEVFYVGMDRGRYRGAPVLVGAALVWARGGVTYRIEGDLDLERALAIADSFESCCR